MIELPGGRISGKALKSLTVLIRKTPARALTQRVLRAQLGIDAARAMPDDRRAPLPADLVPVRARPSHERPSAELGPLPSRTWPRSSAALGQAYRDGNVTPEQVVDRAFDGARKLAALSPSLGPLLDWDEERARATAQSKRGKKLSGPLDGVPIAIKEEVQVEALPARVGTGWMPRQPSPSDCPAVARLRAAGAVILGTTPMTEYGMSPLGVNTHRTMPRNAHDSSRLAGGSSTGSAVAVATGIVPVALGTDGGGSVRIPAAYNGVFGLKPTFGRIPAVGFGSDSGSSVVHIGPLGASSYDLAVFVEAAAGPHDDDRTSLAQPAMKPGSLLGALSRGVRGVRIGVDEEEWAHAADDVARAGREALEALEREGAKLVSVRLPMAEHAAGLGYLTIGLETFAGLCDVRRDHMDELGLDLQILLAQLAGFPPDDYLDAQRLRVTLRRETAGVLSSVDVLALPSTTTAAPQVTDQEARSGFLDPVALDAACRFAFLGNLTGLPAGTAPVGVSSDGLPVGLQIIGDAWDEAAVLSVLAHLERIGVASPLAPAQRIDLLA